MSDFYELSESQQAACMTQLAQAALKEWSIEPLELLLIKYRENAVFKVVSQSGVQYALRIHRADYHSDVELESELTWIEALGEYGIQVPAVVPTKAKKLFAVVTEDSIPEPRQVDVFEWVAGRPLGSIEEGVADIESVPQSYRTIGALAAQLHNQAVDWKPPKGFQRHSWDVAGLVGDEPFWGRFWELSSLSDEERVLLFRAREQARKDLEAYANNPDNIDRYSMIHADFVPDNVMVDGEQVKFIDFDDAGFGWHLFELATALYAQMDESYFDKALAALIEGYREHRSLPEEQVKQLPLFFLLRSFTYLGWIHTRQETETAKMLAPMLTQKACQLAKEYLLS